MPDSTDTTPHKGIFLTQVLSNRQVCRDHWRLTVRTEGFPEARPGQFVQIQCADPLDEHASIGALIRRPFSIAGLRRSGRHCEIDIIQARIGQGTHWLSQLRPDDRVSFLGPLGQPFRVSDDKPIALLVGGGVGLPPLIWLAQTLQDAGKRVLAFCGARTAELLPLTRRADVPVTETEPALAFEEFAQSDTPVIVGTDDGSLGAAGQIPNVFDAYLDVHLKETAGAVVYTCGPPAMVKAVAASCLDRKMECQVCLERMMACGMGTCQSCVVSVRDATQADGWQYQLCCTDGPVFDAREVIWED